MASTLGSPIPPRLSIWTSPRATIRAKLLAGPTFAAWFLPALSGIVQSFVEGASNSVGRRAAALWIVGMAGVIGTAWGVLQLFVTAGVLHLVGRWTGGRATFTQLRIALAWAAAPQALVVVVWLVGTLLAGRFLFVDPERIPDGQTGAIFVALFVWLTTLAGAVWWAILVVIGVAEAQGVSLWKALGNLVVAALMIGVAAVLVVAVVVL